MAAGWYPGRCKDCAEPATEGSRCKACRAAKRAYDAARRAERKRKRQCWACGEACVRDDSGRWLSSCQAHRGTEWRSANAAAQHLGDDCHGSLRDDLARDEAGDRQLCAGEPIGALRVNGLRDTVGAA